MTEDSNLTSLQKARIAFDKKRAAGELVRLDPIQKANANPTSLRFAINAKCCDCAGGNDEPNWRARVKYCNIIKCTLHPVRQYRKGVSIEDCLAWKETGT